EFFIGDRSITGGLAVFLADPLHRIVRMGRGATARRRCRACACRSLGHSVRGGKASCQDDCCHPFAKCSHGTPSSPLTCCSALVKSVERADRNAPLPLSHGALHISSLGSQVLPQSVTLLSRTGLRVPAIPFRSRHVPLK